MQKLESENQTLMLKEHVSKQELQDAHKEAFETASQICGGYFAVDFVDRSVRLHDIRTPDLLFFEVCLKLLILVEVFKNALKRVTLDNYGRFPFIFLTGHPVLDE
ncbi:hypothetical protein LguiA_030398 [Lonicera macranthoides]